MKQIRIEDSVGCILSHDVTKIVPGEFKGRLFKKGHVIREEDIPKLLDIGKEHIYVWEPKKGQLHENDAAIRVKDLVLGQGCYISEEIKEGKILGEYEFNKNLSNYLLTLDEAKELSDEIDIQNTIDIANKCNVELTYTPNLLPIYDENIDSKKHLYELSHKGLKRRLKDINDRASNLSKMIEGIDSYKFEYTDEAKNEYPDEAKDGEHIGVMAQELEQNPVTAPSVVEDENGIKHVDVKELTLEQMAIIADMARRISTLEEAVLRGEK